MRLLISVSGASEARAALAGGADFIDAKNPWAGAMGAVRAVTLRQITCAVNGARSITAALGDATDEAAIERKARQFARAGAAFVKVGFAGVASPERVALLVRAAIRGASEVGVGMCGVVAVAYADASRVSSLAPQAMIRIAARAGAAGVLIDTADKNGPGLPFLIQADQLQACVREAHERGLFAALAGQLALGDLPAIRDLGADIAGVRGAACEGGRTGRVSAERVRQLKLCLKTTGLPSLTPQLKSQPLGLAGIDDDRRQVRGEDAKEAGVHQMLG